jgi:hypothetical protein
MKLTKLMVMAAVILMIISLAVLPSAPVIADPGDGNDVWYGISADSSPEWQQNREALIAQWEADSAAATRQGANKVSLGMYAENFEAVGTSPTGAGALSNGSPTYVCFPTCSETDAHFLSLAGTGADTLAGDAIQVEFAAPSTATALEIGIFDGDTSGDWDQGSVPLEYTLYADRAADGSGTVQVGQWMGSTMTDNAWFTINVPTGPEAQTPSGHYFYNLRVRNTNPSVYSWSNFKVRTTGTLTLKPEAFAFSGPLTSLKNLYTIYPGWPALTPTSYDGSWNFYLDVPTSTSFLTVWDGDMDYGSSDCIYNDTDDSDTPNNVLPPWAVGTAAVPEGVAVGTMFCAGVPGQKTTGSPPDDNSFDPYRRPPSVIYEVIDPSGNHYLNNNPSGNLEWEQFRIDSDPTQPADYPVAGLLQHGIYHIHVTGLDLTNLNAWRFFHDVLCVDENGNPCTPLRPYLVGDYVWYDANGDGVQNEGPNAGIGGVVVELLDSNGTVIATTTTASDGSYTFPVEAGTYTVRIAASNFNPGGVLDGRRPTVDYSIPPDGVGDNERTQTVVNANVMTYDFGYIFEGQGSGSAEIGNQVWLDSNGNGIFEPGLGEAGIANVTVDLWYDFNGDGVYETFVGTATTDGHGEYYFLQLADGRYLVDVTDLNGVLTGMTLTSGPFPGVNNNSQTDPYALSITNQANNYTADFGYLGPASLGDFVWEDLNGNGIQDGGESGIAGVTVELYDSSGNLKGTDTTDADGYYRFYVMPGDYYVKFTPPTGYSFSPQDQGGDDAKDSDADTIGKTAITNLTLGENDLTWDAGLYQLASIGDYVWEDINGNGIQDDGNTGIAGVTVELYDSSGNWKGNGIQDDGNTGIAGVTVELYDSSGNWKGTDITDADGYYRFYVMPGNYYVKFVEPPGYFSPRYQGSNNARDSDANPDDGQTIVTTLISGENDTTWDAGLYMPASLGDYVWMDSNRNGIQEPVLGEIGIANVMVKLYTSAGAPVATTTTGANGYYLFTDLMPGSYTVWFVKPVGYSFSPQDNPNTTDALDSDANPTTGRTTTITLVSGQEDLRWDAGLYLMTSPGTGTPGYWMNHPEAWPVDSITIGGRTYTRDQAIDLMLHPTKGDVTYIMFQALVAAKLNVGIGNNSSCIGATILAADGWMARYPVGSNVKAGGAGSPWRQGEPLYLELDAYNNGLRCAPHRN